MPTLSSTTAIASPSNLLSQVPFNGLIVISATAAMNRVGCCAGGDQCMLIEVTNGVASNYYSYRSNEPTATGLVTLTQPVTLPPTTGDEFFRLGYMSGDITDLLANLPVSDPCRTCYTYELRIPDVASLEINDFMANSQIAGATAASVNELQVQVNQLLSNIDDLGATNNSLQVQLQTSQDNLASTQNDLTTASDTLQTTQASLTDANATISDLSEQLAALQAQIDALNAAEQDTTAATNAAQAVRNAISALSLRDLSVCADAQTTLSSSSTATATSTAAATNETSQALSGGSSGGKIIPLRPSIAQVDCMETISPFSVTGSGSTSVTTPSPTPGKVLNFGSRNSDRISGCAPAKQESSGCCKPRSSPPTSPTKEDTQSAIANILAGAQPFYPSISSREVCELIEKEKSKVLVQPGCSEPQEISPQSDCVDAALD